MAHGATLTLEIPADPAYLVTARLFAAAAAAVTGMTPDQVADMELAISDVCTLLLRANDDGHGDERLVVSITGTGHGAAAEVSPMGYAPPLESLRRGDDADEGVAMGMALVEALAHDVAIDQSDSSLVVRFTIGAAG